MIINHQITKHDFQTNSLWANHRLHHRPSLGSVGGSLVPSWMGTRPGALQFRKKCKDRIWGDPMNLSGRNICNYVHEYIYIYNNYVLLLLLIVYIYIYIYVCITMQIPIKYMTIRISAIHGRGENNLRPFSNNHGHLDGQSDNPY